MKFTWNQILILYVLMGTISCNFLPIPELVKGVIATPAFLIIPYLFGHIILTALKKSIDISLSKISHIFISFAVGFIFIPIIAFLLHTFPLFNAVVYSFFILLIFSIYFVKSKRYDKIVEVKELNFINAEVIMFLLTFLFAVLFFYVYQPFPFILNVDVPQHIATTYLLKDYNFFYYQNSYNPTIASIIASLSVLFQADVYTLWWCNDLIVSPFLGLFGLYILSFKIFHDKRIYFIAFFPLLFALSGLMYSIIHHSVILILFIFIIYVIEKELIPMYSKIKFKNLLIMFILFIIIYFLLFLYLRGGLFTILQPIIGYQNLGIGIFLLFSVIFFLPILLKKRFNISPENFKIIFLMTIVMLLLYNTHIDMAMLIFPFLLLYLIIRYVSEKNYTIVRILNTFVILIFLIIFLLQYYSIYNFEVRGVKQISSTILTNGALEFSDKVHFLIHDFWTFTIFLFLLIGILFGTSDNKYKKILLPLIIIIFGLFSFFFFIKALAVERAISFANPIISMFIAYAIIKISSFSLHKKNKIKIVIITICIVILIFNIIYPMTIGWMEKRIMDCHGNPGLVTIEEYNAGKWMQKNLQKTTVIISDPRTTYDVGASSQLRYINMRLPFSMQKNTTDFVFNILSLSDAYKMHTILTEIITWQNITTDYGVPEYSKKSFVIVISNKTAVWLKGLYSMCPSTNHPLTKEDIKPFLNITYFTLLYNDSSKLYIFGVNPKPGVSFKIHESFDGG